MNNGKIPINTLQFINRFPIDFKIIKHVVTPIQAYSGDVHQRYAINMLLYMSCLVGTHQMVLKLFIFYSKNAKKEKRRK